MNRQRMCDLVAIDLDGTLLRRDGSISARNIGAMSEAVDAGMQIVVATGRAWTESVHALRAIGLPGVFVGAGGAILNNVVDGSTIERNAMDPDLVHSVTERILSHSHLVHLLKDHSATGYEYLVIGDGDLDPATEWWFRTLPVRVRFAQSIEEDEHPAHTIRCGTVSSATSTERLAAQLRSVMGERIFVQHWAALTDPGDRRNRTTHLLEVYNPDADKWTMIDRFCERVGISTDRVAAIGDGLNDVQMVREAAFGIAVGNADPGVIHVADHIVPSNEEDGVAAALHWLLSS